MYLQNCVEVIRCKKANPKSGARAIADHFGCGRTQIQFTLKQATEILKEYEENAGDDKKRKRAADYVDVNEAVYKWYCLGRDRNIPISGIMLQEEAPIIARKLGHPEFKASNGLLQSFKLHHNLKQLTVCGESAEVPEETVEVWHERMKDLVIGYSAQIIWNADESGCFYRSLPEKTLAQAAAQCKGGKKSKNRVTVTFFVNAAGGKEPPIVIGKSASKDLKTSLSPVEYLIMPTKVHG